MGLSSFTFFIYFQYYCLKLVSNVKSSPVASRLPLFWQAQGFANLGPCETCETWKVLAETLGDQALEMEQNRLNWVCVP